MRNLYLLTCLVTVVTVVSASAQSFYAIRRDRSLIATLGINSSTYYGDLKDNTGLDAKPSLSLGVMMNVAPRIAVRGEFSWITLSGDDAKTGNESLMVRNLSFTSNNYEVNFSGQISLFPHKGRFYQRPKFNAYGFAGIGALYFNPKAELDGKKYALQPLKTSGVDYSRLTVVIPYGFGIKTRVSPFIDFGIEVGFRKLFTDYIDDVSGRYIDNASFTDPVAQKLADRRPEIGLPLARAGAIRGGSSKDNYMLLTAKIGYYLPFLSRSSNGGRKIYSVKRRRPSHR
ncbi:DUF6089 family protein [Chryseosolibacter indicus]|uniref:Outer membrane beta-barrel protein n=1 Tax=Chryseosolibacter indicus TaxID=2782351 RepID=A0ABS5VWC0_9BACT|nr:DUF6089 family protein [Chryseosolibacter indicus]MBT1705353.1 outer membrane beta-barrel protein [Chryseosolibacter indicus]